MANSPKQNKPSLARQVEKIVVPSVDSLDPNLDGYLASFFNDFRALSPMEPIDLTTKENATEALKVIQRNHEDLQAKLRTARALKSLLEAKKQH